MGGIYEKVRIYRFMRHASKLFDKNMKIMYIRNMAKKLAVLVIFTFFYRINAFAAGMGEKEYYFDEQPSYSILCSKDAIIKKLDKILFRSTIIRLSRETEIFHVQFRSQPFTELPKQPIFNAGFYDGDLTGTFYFNFIYHEENKTIILVSGKIATNKNNFPSDDVFISTFETNIIDYINDNEIAFNNIKGDYQHNLFGVEQIRKIEICRNLSSHSSWGSRDGDGLQRWRIRDKNIIKELYKLSFLGNTIKIDPKYYWYRFPDVIIAIEYDLTQNEKDSIVNRINNEMNNMSEEELDFRPPSPSSERRFPTQREIFEKQLMMEIGPRNFMIHIWKNNNQYVSQVSDNSIYYLVDIDIFLGIVNGPWVQLFL
jgi:hypothetical protein